MNSQKLSELYFFSCDEIQRLTTSMYEKVHDAAGNPIGNPDIIKDIVSDYKFKITQEITAIKEACAEFAEG